MPTPDDARIVVSNTTPIIALGLVERLDILSALYEEVVVPEAVQGELRAGPESKRLSLEAAPVRVMPIRDSSHASLISDLDRGEAEAIALALEERARLLIIDERLGRAHARRLGIPLTGTLGVLPTSQGPRDRECGSPTSDPAPAGRLLGEGGSGRDGPQDGRRGMSLELPGSRGGGARASALLSEREEVSPGIPDREVAHPVVRLHDVGQPVAE